MRSVLGNDLNESNLIALFEGVFGKATDANAQFICNEYFRGIGKVLQKMRFYYEEGTHIVFRLAIGCEVINVRNADFDDKIDPRVRLYTKGLKFTPLNNVDGSNIIKETYAAVKKVLPCCSDNSDAYVVLKYDHNDGENYYYIIEAGIYFLDLGKAQEMTESLLDEGYALAECVDENKVVITSKTSGNMETDMLKFDLEDVSSPQQGIFYQFNGYRTIDKYYRNVFERIRRNCHGTMCLIVAPTFNMDALKCLKLITNEPNAIEGLNIAPASGNGLDVVEEHSLQIFFGLLNFDGFTVIDTYGKIISYNNFCASTASGEVGGGSRHKAYESMKQWDVPGLVGLYFQSQEGEIHYYSYPNHFFSGAEYDYFDVKNIFALNYEEDKELIKILEKNEEISKSAPSGDQNTKNAYGAIMNAINSLAAAHDGMNNFHTEAGYACSLYEYYIKPVEWKNWLSSSLVTMGKDFAKLRKEMLDVVLVCMVGNYYGPANEAQNLLRDIFNALPFGWIKEYFCECHYLTPYLLQELRSNLPYHRWKTVVYNCVKDRNNVVSNDEKIGRSYLKKAFEDYDNQAFMELYSIMVNRQYRSADAMKNS